MRPRCPPGPGAHAQMLRRRGCVGKIRPPHGHSNAEGVLQERATHTNQCGRLRWGPPSHDAYTLVHAKRKPIFVPTPRFLPKRHPCFFQKKTPESYWGMCWYDLVKIGGSSGTHHAYTHSNFGDSQMGSRAVCRRPKIRCTRTERQAVRMSRSCTCCSLVRPACGACFGDCAFAASAAASLAAAAAASAAALSCACLRSMYSLQSPSKFLTVWSPSNTNKWSATLKAKDRRMWGARQGVGVARHFQGLACVSDGSNWGGGCPSLPPPPRFVTRRHNTRHKKTRSQPFGCHNIFRKAVFPLWPIVFFVTCHNSLPPPPPPPPPPEWRTN